MKELEPKTRTPKREPTPERATDFFGTPKAAPSPPGYDDDFARWLREVGDTLDPYVGLLTAAGVAGNVAQMVAQRYRAPPVYAESSSWPPQESWHGL